MTVIIVLFFLFSYVVSLPNEKTITVAYDEQRQIFQLTNHPVSNWAAKAAFNNNINQTGWAYLDIETNPALDNDVQAYAAGLAEGQLTQELISLHWRNTAYTCPEPYTPFCQRLRNFLTQNLNWVKSQIDAHQNDQYWEQVKLFYMQTAGLQDGYFNNPKAPHMDIDIFGLYVFQIGGDMEDLEPALNKPTSTRVRGSGSCSALIKLLPGNKDLYVSQDTWDTYNSMLRILKKYTFPYTVNGKNSDRVPGTTMTFSSYPGTLMSGDDFYQIDSGLVSLETTIGNSNADRWKYVQFQSVLEGIRSQVANRLAVTGEQWASTFSNFNSGTYNNEWLIVDYKLFERGMNSLKPGTLTVLEQIPGLIVFRDTTSVLVQQGYFPSYNVAYFPEVFNASGGPESVKKYGDWFSYDGTPRAKIFKRDHVKVGDLKSMQKLMRYNDFQHDPLARCNCTPPYSGENGISARCDLNPASGTYPFGALGHRAHGGTDMKLTSFELFNNGMSFIAILSPTYDQQVPFQWSKTDFPVEEFPRFGHPDLFKFPTMFFNGSAPLNSYPIEVIAV
ncbi:putative phospholipase B-like 2 [Gigantopelta aegis]|uniref:putative phospholipase B-like 2 n=1 Tax=Gigantopelta aegis TaxID=1735272 RepID=UPI001B88813D|nr:putative phospholipase B-like 2 [Gigantopelta aegis]